MSHSGETRPATGRMIEDHEVVWVSRCELRLGDAPWPFAIRNQAAIGAHWQRRLAENPRMFNGPILILVEHELHDDIFHGTYARTDFASYLYWRETGFNDAPTCDAFALTLLAGREGGWLVARAADHTLNAGLYVAPGGLIDERDADPAGRVDIRQSALRELAEETGLTLSDLAVEDGMWIARDGALMAMALPCTSRLSNAAIIDRVNGHNRADPEAELDNARWLMPGDDGVDASMRLSPVPKFLELLFGARTGQTAHR